MHGAACSTLTVAARRQCECYTRSRQVLEGIWRMEHNASRFDKMLPFGLSLYQFSLFNPAISLESNTTEIYHSGIKVRRSPARYLSTHTDTPLAASQLDNPVTKEKTHDYLLLSSPRKVRA